MSLNHSPLRVEPTDPPNLTRTYANQPYEAVPVRVPSEDSEPTDDALPNTSTPKGYSKAIGTNPTLRSRGLLIYALVIYIILFAFSISGVVYMVRYYRVVGMLNEGKPASGELSRLAIRPRSPNWVWVKTDAGEDGVYTTLDKATGDIWLRYANHWGDPRATGDKLLINRDTIDSLEPDHPFTEYYLSPDLKFIAVASHVGGVWRHSFTARYRIFDLNEPHHPPVVVAPNPAQSGGERSIALFRWSTKGHDASFVAHNDIYILTDDFKTLQRVTHDGKGDVFNGIPDWVYEEEVLAGNSALWWSPDARLLAYLKFDDRLHGNRMATTPIPDDPNEDPAFLAAYADYPQHINIKYPKPGHRNPNVTLHIHRVGDAVGSMVTFDFRRFDPEGPLVAAMLAQPENRIICDVVWGGASELLVRLTNRQQNTVATARCPAEPTGQPLVAPVVRLEPGGLDFKHPSAGGDGGWYPTDTHPILPLYRLGSNHPGYVDRVIVGGYYHLALFETLDAPAPAAFLTEGGYDVERALGVDVATGHLYYASRQLDSTARHIYSVHISSRERRHISDEGSPGLQIFNGSRSLGHFDADLSPGVGGWCCPTWARASRTTPWCASNHPLRRLIAAYDLPSPTFSNVTVNGTALNVMELLPPNPSKPKLRVLFRCYGGPESQAVSRSFQVGFHTWLVSKLTDVAVVVVDGHGTGFKGRAFAVGVAHRLGHLESRDQLGAIAAYAKYGWVDASHLGLWGWSFGGYLAAKVVELDAGHRLTAAASVAPVSDWHFYDSVYTERYLGTPQANPIGYRHSAVNQVGNFNVTSYLLIHGAADDNVGIQNAFNLLDKFNRRRITRPALAIFPDSNHAIGAYHANAALYRRLYEHFRDYL
ncbi:hypothetical protein L0F63_001144 [Massospora cicadina]|nr:hypothetical protein L0F63_001144 [Massospora cicadina]